MVRLILAIISTIVEEAALVAIGVWGLPRLGVLIPLPVTIVVAVTWGVYSVFTYRAGSRMLKKKPLFSLSDMVGCQGEVVSPLDPAGLVKIKGEIWTAKSDGGNISCGEPVVVVGQERLKLVVRAGGLNDEAVKSR